MKLHEFTSEYTVLIAQSSSDGTYWASIYKGDNTELVKETDNYEDYEDAMAKAMHYVNQEGNRELDEARHEKYTETDEVPDRWGHPDE